MNNLPSLAAVSDEVNQYIPVWRIRQAAELATNYVMNYTEAEAKVREATNEDPWGPPGPILQEITRYTSSHICYGEVMGMLWSRMCQDNEDAWRRVYKSLLVLEHLVKHGNERVINNAKERIYDLRTLTNYRHIDHKGKDQGINVKNRARILVEMLGSDDNIRDARAEAKRNKAKFGGVGSSGRSGGSSSHNTDFGNGGRYDQPSSNSNEKSNKSESFSGGLGGGYDDYKPTKTSPSKNEHKPYDTEPVNFENKFEAISSNDQNNFDADWASAPSTNTPVKVAKVTGDSFDDNNDGFEANWASAPSASTKVVNKSVPRRMISLGAAASYQAPAVSRMSNSQSAPVVQNKTAQPPAKTAQPVSNFDLLGGLGETTPSSQNNNNWDPFSSNASSNTVPTPVKKLPAQQVQKSQNADPFGDWMNSGSAATTTPIQTALTPKTTNINDIFGSISNTQASTFKPTFTPQNSLVTPSTNYNLSDSFAAMNVAPQPNKTAQPERKASLTSANAGSTWAGIGGLDSLMSNNSGPSKGKSMNSMISPTTNSQPKSNPDPFANLF